MKLCRSHSNPKFRRWMFLYHNINILSKIYIGVWWLRSVRWVRWLQSLIGVKISKIVRVKLLLLKNSSGAHLLYCSYNCIGRSFHKIYYLWLLWQSFPKLMKYIQIYLWNEGFHWKIDRTGIFIHHDRSELIPIYNLIRNRAW